MRVVIDTNILVSALLAGTSLPGYLITLWQDGRFDLLTAAEQFSELTRVTRYEKIRARVNPAIAGRLINELRDLAIVVTGFAPVTICPDPEDNYLLAIAVAGAADFLITGDKRDLLGLKRYEGTKIVTVREFLVLHQSLPDEPIA